METLLTCPYIRAEIAKLFQRERFVGVVEFLLMLAPENETGIGILSGEPEVIDLIVAKAHYALHMTNGQVIEIDVDGPGEADGTMAFTCHNPLLGADDVGTAA